MIASADQIGVAEFPVAVTLLTHGGEKGPAPLRRETEAEAFGDGRRDPAPGHIVGAALALGCDKLLIKPSRCVPVGRKQPRAFLRVPVIGILRHLHSGTFGQKCHRIRIGEIFDLHDEVDHAAALAAAEAVVELACRIHRERRSPLIMKRTEPEEICSAALPEGDVTADDIDDVTALRQFLNKVFRKGHGVLTNSSLADGCAQPKPSLHRPGKRNKPFAVFFHCVSVGHPADVIAGGLFGTLPLQYTAEIRGQFLRMRDIDVIQ